MVAKWPPSNERPALSPLKRGSGAVVVAWPEDLVLSMTPN
jgi:hypothetical protein